MNAPAATLREPERSLISYTHWMYGLHALSAVTGMFGSAAVAIAFVFGIPSIIAVIMNYARRAETRDTYLESHFQWQLRTFWLAALWIGIVFLLSLPLFLVLIGFLTFPLGMFIVGVWVVYRVLRGWLRLRDAQPI
jgi:uncharacterized membrane protein